MTARQQIARLLPLAVLVLLAAVGLRGGITGLGWNGPLRAYGPVIGLALEVILGTLLGYTYYRDRVTAGWSPADDDDRDVARSLRFLLRLLLYAAMLAIAVLELVNLHLHLFSRRGQPVKLPVPFGGRPHGPKSPLGRGAGGAFRLHVALGPILYSLLVLALLAALVFSIWLARRVRRAALPGAVADDLTEDPAELLEAVASGRAAMANLSDARAAIIACYAAMEARLAERGAARGAADTPDELLRRAMDQGVVRGSASKDSASKDGASKDGASKDGASKQSAARRLTTLFYEARFSTHELGPQARDAALAALDDLAAELAGAAS
jgi:hypothetical protein